MFVIRTCAGRRVYLFSVIIGGLDRLRTSKLALVEKVGQIISFQKEGSMGLLHSNYLMFNNF